MGRKLFVVMVALVVALLIMPMALYSPTPIHDEHISKTMHGATPTAVQFMDKRGMVSRAGAVLDAYFASFSKADCIARGCPGGADECKSMFLRSVMPSHLLPPAVAKRVLTSVAEAARLWNLLSATDPMAGWPGRDTRNIPWRVAVLAEGGGSVPEPENGLPHTHADVICLSMTWILGTPPSTRVCTFLHERVHVLQKLFPGATRMHIIKNMGYVDGGALELGHRQEKLRRRNPDVNDDVMWLDKEGYTCIAMYNSTDPEDLGDILIHKLKKLKLQKQNENKGDGSGNNRTGEFEHPLEEMAYRFFAICNL